MDTPLFIIFILALSSSHPVDQVDETTLTFESTTVVDHQLLQRDLMLVSYIQNFKQVMAEYVNSQYKNLTVAEMEKVKLTLHDFLQNFATDLRETIDGKNNDNDDVVDDSNDETFVEIKRKIILEFPEVTEDVAGRIIMKLKKNLHTTRNKLDDIIRASYQAQIENS